MYVDRCKVCTSPNVASYHELYKQGAKDLVLSAKATEFSEQISQYSFYRHRKHILVHPKNQKEVEEMVNAQIEASLRLADEIYNNLDQARMVTQALLRKAPDDPESARAAATMMKEIRESLQAARKLKDELGLRPVESKQTVITDLLQLLRDEDPALIERLLAKVKNVGYIQPTAI